MYLSQRATSNSTIQGIITLATKSMSQGGGDQSRNAIEVVFEFLGICLRWTARQVYRAIAALLRGLKVPELLDFIFRALFQILKWCSIGLAIAVGVPVTIQVGYWGVQKLLQMRHERRMKQHNEILRKEQEEFHEADMRERQARRKAERLREEEERQRRERENEAIKAKLKREEEQRLKEAREIFMMWDKECALVLCNKASMAKFPFPPLPRCTVLDARCLLKRPHANIMSDSSSKGRASCHFNFSSVTDTFGMKIVSHLAGRNSEKNFDDLQILYLWH